MDSMEEFPTDLVVLMDELSPIEFLKLALYKMNKMTIESTEELTELDKVMCKAVDISTKMKLNMISPALRERFFKLVAEKGLNKPPSLLLGCSSEQAIQAQAAPSQAPSLTPAYQQPTLFQNPMTPSEKASFQPNTPDMSRPMLFQNVLADAQPPTPSRQDSDPFNKRVNSYQLESYKTEPFEADISVQPKTSIVKKTAQQVSRRQYREQSMSPPAAYKSRSSSRHRGGSRWSRSPPSRRSRSPPSRSRSPPSRRSRSPPSRRSRSPPSRRSRSPPSRRSRSPPAAYKGRSSSRPRMPTDSSRRSRSPPSYRSFSRFDASSKLELARDEPKTDENSSSRKSLSFSFTNRKKYAEVGKPPIKF